MNFPRDFASKMRQILLISLLLLIANALSVENEQEKENDKSLKGKNVDQSEKSRGEIEAPLGSARAVEGHQDGAYKNDPQNKPKGQGKVGSLGATGSTHIDGKSLPPRKKLGSDEDGDGAKPSEKKMQPARDETESSVKKSQPAKDETGPSVKKLQPARDETEPIVKKSQPARDETGPSVKKSQPARDETGPSVKKSQSAKETTKPAVDNSKLKQDGSDDSNQRVAKSNLGKDSQDSKPNTAVEPKGGEIRDKTQEKVQTLGKVDRSNETNSSSSSFVTYFIVAVVIIIILYLVFHNKKKLMAYMIEGRNTGRAGRNRGSSGAEYKPLKNSEEATGCRTESV